MWPPAFYRHDDEGISGSGLGAIQPAAGRLPAQMLRNTVAPGSCGLKPSFQVHSPPDTGEQSSWFDPPFIRAMLGKDVARGLPGRRLRLHLMTWMVHPPSCRPRWRRQPVMAVPADCFPQDRAADVELFDDALRTVCRRFRILPHGAGGSVSGFMAHRRLGGLDGALVSLNADTVMREILQGQQRTVLHQGRFYLAGSTIPSTFSHAGRRSRQISLDIPRDEAIARFGQASMLNDAKGARAGRAERAIGQPCRAAGGFKPSGPARLYRSRRHGVGPADAGSSGCSAGATACTAAADSTGGRNTLVFLQRWTVSHEVSHTDVLH